MPIQQLSIDRFRNLQPVALQLSPHLNLFTGHNAAGKTSLLESLYVLARGRSFRSRHLEKLVQTGESGFRLVVQLAQEGRKTVPVGMERVGNRLVCRIDRQPVRRLSELAALFPVQWLGGNPQSVIDEGPANRRQFLDWGLFHVKPDYMESWKRFQKLLKQRNASIRAGNPSREIQVWDTDLAEAGETLDTVRQAYLARFVPEVEELGKLFPVFAEDVNILYRRGWAKEQEYRDVLRASLETDRESGFTRSGPHRAELALSYCNKPARERLSRGQQKAYVIAMHLAQASLLYKDTKKTSLFLLDDLGAELDQDNQAKVMDLLKGIQAQVFVTSIEALQTAGWDQGAKRFHVKHGQVSEVV